MEGARGWISQLGDESPPHPMGFCAMNPECSPGEGLGRLPLREKLFPGWDFPRRDSASGGLVPNGPRARVPAPWGAQVPFHAVTNSCCQLDVLT